MKLVCVVLFALIGSNSFGQNENCVRDTVYHRNRAIYSIYDVKGIEGRRCGYYSEYDTLGRLTLEGAFVSVDSALCKDCYYIESGEILELKYTATNELPVGEWMYYYSDGTVKEKGHYSSYVKAYEGTAVPFINDNRPHNVYIHIDFLKEGDWEYYDALGGNYMSINYHRGTIVFKTERY